MADNLIKCYKIIYIRASQICYCQSKVKGQRTSIYSTRRATLFTSAITKNVPRTGAVISATYIGNDVLRQLDQFKVTIPSITEEK